MNHHHRRTPKLPQQIQAHSKTSCGDPKDRRKKLLSLAQWQTTRLRLHEQLHPHPTAVPEAFLRLTNRDFITPSIAEDEALYNS